MSAPVDHGHLAGPGRAAAAPAGDRYGIEGDRAFYERRAAEEASAAGRAITGEARARHQELARLYERKARRCAAR